MTVSYNFNVQSSSLGNVTKILFRWKGSVWKAVYSELLCWITFYLAINLCLRTCFNDNQIENFKIFRGVLLQNLPRIPLTFLLSFFVTTVFNRWSDIFKKMGFIENIALAISTAIIGDDNDTKRLKQKLIRYAVLSQALVFRDISLEVRNRFPKKRTLVTAGIMTENEYIIFKAQTSKCKTKYWMPLQWAMRHIWQARSKGKICIDVVAWNLCEKYREFRTDLQLLCNYDYVPVPLSYPQIVYLCVRGYFCLNVIARQTLSCDLFDIGPLMTLFEFILLIGWIKVAETLLNPFGTDDDDFECNYILNRNFSIGYEIVNQTFLPNSLPPDDENDIFLHMPNPAPLDDFNDQKRTVEPYIGSVAAEVNKGDEGDFPFSATVLKRRLTSFNSNKSINKGVEKSSTRRPSIDPVRELAAHALPTVHNKLSIVEEEKTTQETDKSSPSLPKRD